MEVQIKPEYKKQAFYTILSIVFFMLSFVLILTLTLFISYYSFKMGVYLMEMFLAENLGLINLLILFFGLGFLFFGFFISAYTFKFLFNNQRVDLSLLKEIKRNEEPLLFKMVEDLVKEIGTHFPNKIYLSPEVNSLVFYNQGMINLFLPSRKNLVIGLGLVNALTEEELKSVLAHEFGHFSQNSMKIGAYSTNLENIVIKILFKNENLNQMFKHVLGFHWFASVFGLLVIPYIRLIEWSLSKSFNFVQVNNRALSREMEFHADAIAANVSGTKTFQSALMKMEFSHLAFNEAIKYLPKLESKKMKPKSFYELHTMMIKAMCEMNHLEFKNGLPVIQIEDVNRINRSKLYIKDKYATHPDMMDRIKNLNELNITKAHVHPTPAIGMINSKDFFDSEGINKFLMQTPINQELNESIEVVNIQKIEEMYFAEIEEKRFDAVYCNYFDLRNIELSVWDQTEPKEPEMNLSFDEDLVDTTKQLDAMNQDKMALLEISESFD
ncbi:MAG TPA: M48 family metallopeptidase, partial [Bacteroidia bacterium]